MNIYQMIGGKVATPEALELAQRLSSWHDEMVAHERSRMSRCDEECPHVLAPVLWEQAAETFGRHASELAFLRSRGVRRDVRGVRP